MSEQGSRPGWKTIGLWGAGIFLSFFGAVVFLAALAKPDPAEPAIYVLTLACIGVGALLVALARRDTKPEQSPPHNSHDPSPPNEEEGNDQAT